MNNNNTHRVAPATTWPSGGRAWQLPQGWQAWLMIAAALVALWSVFGGGTWLSRSEDAPKMHPIFETLKLGAAALAGIAITNVRRRVRRDKPLPRALQHAQVLVCVCGALMTVVIGDSLSRALGLAGGATIIRFRTPIKDPQDATLMFLLLGLGMSCGLGAYTIASAGTAFICALLPVLEKFGEPATPPPPSNEVAALEAMLREPAAGRN